MLAGFYSMVLDPFTLSTTSRISQIDAALFGLLQAPGPNFAGFGAAQGYVVNIFSDPLLAASSRYGNVYTTTLDPSLVSFGPGFAYAGPNAFAVLGTSLASLPVDVTLRSGNYWLSVVAINDSSVNDSIGVGYHGVGGAYFANPGGGFARPGNIVFTGAQGGYAVMGEAVPEPATWAMMLLGFAAVGSAARRRQKVRARIAFA